MNRRVCALALASLSGGAQAANISVTIPPDDNPVTVVTLAGEITINDIEDFHIKTTPLKRAIVVFDSPGGAVLAGISIGSEIRAKGFWTFVKRGTRCASACALAWLGGVRRVISPAGFVGFHAAYDARTRLESGQANALVGAYLARIDCQM